VAYREICEEKQRGKERQGTAQAKKNAKKADRAKKPQVAMLHTLGFASSRLFPSFAAFQDSAILGLCWYSPFVLKIVVALCILSSNKEGC